MNWRKERKKNFDRKKQLKKYIKHELMNYYLYLDKIIELRVKKSKFDDISDNPPIGGSIIKMPDGSTGKDGQPHRIAVNKCDVESNLKYYENKLDILDSWMNILTQSQHDVIKVYVMEYQCENIHEAALVLQYEEDTINKYTKRSIEKIYSKMKKII